MNPRSVRSRLRAELLETRETPATGPSFVAGIPDVQFLVNRSSGALSFQVADPDPGDLANLTITATVETSPDPAFLPAGSIAFGGSGANRTVTVTPTAGKTGQAAIAIRIADPSGRNSTDRFTITVRGYASDIPLPNALTFADTSGYTLPNPANYPGGVFYVAPEVSTVGGVPAGKSTNLNTAASPLTVAEAFARIDAIPWNRRDDNVAVIFRGGDYRGVSFQSSYKNALLLQAYPGENPVLKGTEVVTNWTASGGRWYTASDPTGPLNFEKPRGSSEFGNFTGQDVDFVDPIWNPLSANREQVFINGQPKWQVGSLAEVAADTFFVDYDAHRIYIGENPTAKTVEVTAHEFAMKLWFIDDPDRTSVRGLNFLGYGAVGLWIGGISARVEDGVFAWNGVNGMYISSGSPDCIVTNNEFVSNGNGGARIQSADRVQVIDNIMRYNGIERPNAAWDTAGTKITRLSDALVKGNLVEHNYGTGIWYDSSTFRTMTVDNVVRFNGSGVFVEISHDDAVAFNIIHDNNYGILVSGASDTRIYNNTLVNNGTAVVVREDDRINDPTLNTVGPTTRPAESLVGNTWDTYGTVLVNNIYSGINETVLTYGTTIVELSRTLDQPVIYTVIDQYNLTDPNKTKTLPMTSASMVYTSDYNLYFDPSAIQPTAVRWDPTPTFGGQINYATPAAFAAAVPGYESHAVVGNPLFVGTPGDDRLYYRLRSSSPAVGKATTVPVDILAAVGRAQPTYLGAVPPDTAPTVTAGPTFPATVTGTTAALSVRAADDAGEPSLKYTWSVVGTPPAAVSFSPNGSNAAQNATATFARSGTYTLRVAIDDGSGNVVTRDFTLTVVQTPTAVVRLDTDALPGAPIPPSDTRQFAVAVVDQFSRPLEVQPPVTWSLSPANRGTITSSGLYTAPSDVGGPVAVVASVAGFTSTATVNLLGTGPSNPKPPAPGEPPATPGKTRGFAVGADAGGSPIVRLYNADGSLRLEATAFDAAFAGGVRTATGDFTGDGIPDVVVGTGPGAATLVRVLDGSSGSVLFEFAPFESAFTGGVFVAAGDLTGDGVPDVVVTPDEGGGPRVLVFDGVSGAIAVDFFGIDDPSFRGGARTAIGDVNGDGIPDLLVAAGFGGGPRLAGYDGKNLTGERSKLFADLYVFEQSLRNGVYVAAADLDGDGRADLVAGGGPGGGPRVFALSGADLVAGLGSESKVMANFFGGDPNGRGGARIAAANLDGDDSMDLVVGAGKNSGSRVTGYLTQGKTWEVPPAEAFAIDAFESFSGGIYVG